jgi:hypothetical protein
MGTACWEKAQIATNQLAAGKSLFNSEWFPVLRDWRYARKSHQTRH